MEAAAKREERMRKIRGVKDEDNNGGGEKNNSNKKGKVCGWVGWGYDMFLFQPAFVFSICMCW